MATPLLRIPKQVQASMKLLAGISDQAFDELSSALREMPDSLDPRAVASQVAGRVRSLASTDTKDIVDALLSTYVVRSHQGMDVANFVETVVRAMDETAGAGELTTDERTVLATRLTKLLGYDETIGLSSKALDLSTEYERIFVGCRILTDLRPVFGSDSVASPSGAVISHTLRIDCHLSQGEHTELFITMQASDLAELRLQLDRAAQKEAALRTMLSSTNVRVLSNDMGGAN